MELPTHASPREAWKEILKMKPVGIHNTNWRVNRSILIESTGRDSLATLIPDQAGVSTAVISTLARLVNRGIVTKKQLIECDLEEIRYSVKDKFHRFGDIYYGIAKVMQSVARLDLEEKDNKIE